MERKTVESKRDLLCKQLVIRINTALALLIGLIFFNGTLLEFFDIPSSGFLSMGNVLIVLMILVVGGVFIGWYNERLSGIILILLALFSLVYFLLVNAFTGQWILPFLVVVPIGVAGIYLLRDGLIKEGKLHLFHFHSPENINTTI